MIQRAHLPAVQQAPSLADRLIFWKRDLPGILGVSSRTVDRWLSSGEFPGPDVTVHGRPVWKRGTIMSWCDAK
jgi:hypothetical protein